MPLINNVISIKIDSFDGLFYDLCFDTIIFNNGNFRYNLNFRSLPLIFDMHMNRFMVIRVEEKTYSKYKEDCWHT